MVKDLHTNQTKLLKFIEDNSENDISLSKMREVLGTKSNNLVLHHLKQLEEKGYILKGENGYQLMPQAHQQPMAYIPFYGKSQCGHDGIFLKDPENYVPVFAKFLKTNPKKAFMVEAYGDSMENYIYEGDMIIAEKTDIAKTGNIVVCVVDGEAKIKRFSKENDKITLYSDNIKHPPILIDESSQFRIIGKVIQIIKNFV